MLSAKYAGEETKLKYYVLSCTGTRFGVTISKPTLIIGCQNDYSKPDFSGLFLKLINDRTTFIGLFIKYHWNKT